VPENVVKKLEKYLRKHNPFVKGFLMMKEELQKEKERAKSKGDSERELKLLFSLKKDVSGASRHQASLADNFFPFLRRLPNRPMTCPGSTKLPQSLFKRLMAQSRLHTLS
jgi:hypothetical protein